MPNKITKILNEILGAGTCRRQRGGTLKISDERIWEVRPKHNQAPAGGRNRNRRG